MGEGGDPLVSVVIATFNSEQTIARALKSVQCQTYSNLEVIIADDASTDETRACVEAFSDGRISFLPSSALENKGPADARNRALKKASGKYVAFLDSDDEWFQEKIARQVAYLEAHPDCSIVVSNAYDISPIGTVLGTEFGSSPPVGGSEAWRALLKKSFIETSSVMTRLELVRELGGFDTLLFVSQDQDLWIRLALRGEVAVIQDILGRILEVPSGHMKRNAHRQFDIMLPMIERHVDRLRPRLSREEANDILGFRYRVTGRNLYVLGEYRAGLKCLLKSSRHSGAWLENLFFLCHASPIGRMLKKGIKALIPRRKSRAPA